MMTPRLDFPSETLPLCVACEWLGIHARGHWSCLAFPDGIPEALLKARVDHRVSLPGDGGIQFEPDANAPEGLLLVGR
ncbi:MAG: hypothetical protein NVSMB9_16750 [Isosphaeraceae bacterium]